MGLALAATAATLGLLEAGSYLLGISPGPRQPLSVGYVELFGVQDPLLFWSLEPGASADGGRLWINDQGLRGPEVGEKSAGEIRILSLGESTTFGAQMPYRDTYSAVLERRLSARRPDRTVRVLNAGVPGYSLFQGVTYLRERAAAFEPDVVLLYFGYNDFLPVAYLAWRTGSAAAREGGLTDAELFAERQRPSQRALWLLTRYSNLYRSLAERVSQRASAQLSLDEGQPRVPREHREQLLRTAKQLADEEGIELVLVIPVYREFEDHIELLRRFAERESVTLVDLPRRIGTELAVRPDRYFLDHVHPSPRGHRLIAEAIVEVIEPRLPR